MLVVKEKNSLNKIKNDNFRNAAISFLKFKKNYKCYKKKSCKRLCYRIIENRMFVCIFIRVLKQ